MLYEQQLTREGNFFLSEYTRSETAEKRGIINTLDWTNPQHQQIYKNICNTARNMEIVRQELHSLAIKITSGIRLPLLNRAIGGVSDSQHCTGEANDFQCAGFGTPLEIVKELKDNPKILYDQMIYENDGKGEIWVHVSFTSVHQPRRQLLSLLANGKYAEGLTDTQGKKL